MGLKWTIDHTDMTKINLGLDTDTKKFKFKIYLRIMMVICIKQHLCNIWSSIYEKVKQHWGWVEKSVSYKKHVDLLSGRNIPAG